MSDYYPADKREDWKSVKSIDAILITGANGLLGASIAKKLSEQAIESAKIIAIVRSDKAERELRQGLGAAASRVEILIGDLGDRKSFVNLLPARHLKRVLMIHCAADVSWDKSEDDLTAINIDGTRTAAQFLTSVAIEPIFIYISSAYTQAENWDYRNGYEASKAAAERLLRLEFPDLPLSVFSCSLIIGSSTDGKISRFHGLYPLIRLVSTPGTPFVIGRDACMIDLVPIDWVTDQLLETIHRTLRGETLDVVASAGAGAVRLDSMFRLIEVEINRFRMGSGFTARPELPILSYRRWDFLKRSIEVWKPEELGARDLRQITHLIEIYRPYTMNDQVRAPQNISMQAPSAENLLPSSVRYWLEKHSKQVIGRWQRATDIGH